MTKNIQDKIDEIFSDEYIDNKRLLFSPKKLNQSKTYKNNDKNNDNQINATAKVEKSTETTYYRTSSSKTKKQHIKKIKENPEGNKPILKVLNDLEKNKENNLANEINDKKEIKREFTLKIRQKKKEEKEEKEKQEKEKQEKEKKKEKQEKEKRERKEKEKEKEKREKEKREKEKREKEKKEKEKQEKEKQEKEKQEKEKQEKKDDLDNQKELNIDDDDFPISRYQSRRGRGKSHHIKNKMEVFKGILNKDLTKKKKSKVEFEDIINIKEKIEEENNLSDEKNNKDKDKGNVKPKDKDREKLKKRTYSVVKKKKSICLKGGALDKIRGNIIESKIEINKEDNNNNNNSLLKINSKSPKLKYKKGQKIMDTTKNFYHKNTKGESINLNIHLSQKKCSYPKKQKGSKLLGKKNSLNASIIFSNNDVDSKNSIGSLANGNGNKNEDKKDIIDFKISDSSDFKSSNDSDKKPEQKKEQKSIYKKNKSSKCIDVFGTNKKISKRESKRNISHKKIDFDCSNNKDEKKKNKSNKKLKMEGNKEYISKKEEISSLLKLQSRDSSKYLKNNIRKFDTRITNIKHLKMEPIYNSEIKKVKNKRKLVFPSQYPISNKVTNLIIANGKENNNNLYENYNNNMNIINPGTFISIEYNLNNSKKDTKHLDDNHNDLLINNNEKKVSVKKENKENYKSPSKRDIHENNQSSLIKEIHDNNDSETQNNQKIKEYNDNNNVSNSNNNNAVIYKNTKNRNCFCCL